MCPEQGDSPARHGAANEPAGTDRGLEVTLNPAPDSKPRTGGGRLAASYAQRVAAARQQVAATEHPHGVTDRTTPELMALDNAYTGLGAVLRRRDRDIQRLRRELRRELRPETRSWLDGEETA